MTDQYNQVARDLDGLGALATPSEAQGILIGMWIGAGPVAESRWLGELVDEEAPLAVPASLHGLFTHLYEQLTSADNLGLDILIPGDQESLSLRLEALIEFAQGVLYGYGIENGPPPRAMPPEAREVFEDLREIAELDPQAGDSEEDEVNLHEILGYLSAGLAVMYIALHPPVPAPEPSTRMH